MPIVFPRYGAAGVTTPAITQLAAEGTTFEWAFTPVPLTLPAHASIFTGLQPFRHGVRNNGGFYLDAQRATLASTLKERGVPHRRVRLVFCSRLAVGTVDRLRSLLR